MIVCATSDKSSMERAKAAYVATAIAEYFRDQGKKCCFSWTASRALPAPSARSAWPQASRPRRGYPPSVFATLPKLMERVGMNDKGLHHGAVHRAGRGRRHDQAIADETRSILDGHICSRASWARPTTTGGGRAGLGQPRDEQRRERREARGAA